MMYPDVKNTDQRGITGLAGYAIQKSFPYISCLSLHGLHEESIIEKRLKRLVNLMCGVTLTLCHM